MIAFRHPRALARVSRQADNVLVSSRRRAGSRLAAASAPCAAPAFAQQASGLRPNTADVVIIYGDRIVSDPGSYSVIDDGRYRERPTPTTPGRNPQHGSGRQRPDELGPGIAHRDPLAGPAGRRRAGLLPDPRRRRADPRAPPSATSTPSSNCTTKPPKAIEVVRGPGSVRTAPTPCTA